MCQGLLLHGQKDGRRFGLVGFHEFHARRRVIKKIAHENRRALRAAGGAFLRDLSRV